MTEVEFRDFISKQTFRKAVTAKRNPHAYIVRHKSVVGTDDEFVDAVMFIREHGFEIMLWGKRYTVYYLDGHFYWTMGDPIETTIILNQNNVCDYEVTISPRKEFLQ